jgi:hypothetical protein
LIFVMSFQILIFLLECLSFNPANKAFSFFVFLYLIPGISQLRKRID